MFESPCRKPVEFYNKEWSDLSFCVSQLENMKKIQKVMRKCLASTKIMF